MATVGQQLTAPEAGWKRFDDTNSNISYLSGTWSTTSSGIYSGGSQHYTVTINVDDSFSFNFTGSNLRIIAGVYNGLSNSLQITIDNTIVETFGEYGTNASMTSLLVYEKTGLSDDEHTVIVRNKQSGKPIDLDAIDIDENGELKPYNPNLISAPTNLTSIAGDAQITLSWDAVTNVTDYNVKRSMTAGGPYETIASNVQTNRYLDTDVVNGTTYYYVVTAVTADDESDNSNETSATPQAAPIKVLLRITMSDSSEREYEVTSVVVDDFMAWCNRTLGTGNSCYVFNKAPQNSKEYLFYEKIISFEVIPLAE